jgi:hypothetical protein
LTAHLRFGQTRLDTNLVENSIRPTKLGAKNWLFIGHPDAGERSAIIYSIVVSCRRRGIDPLAYVWMSPTEDLIDGTQLVTSGDPACKKLGPR